MCDEPTEGRTGWKGWMPAPAAAAMEPLGPWQDLTHPFSSRVPRSSIFPAPELTAVARMPEKAFNVTRLDTVVHVGTHLDSPRHFYADGPGMEAVPLDRLMAPGVVVPLDKDEGAEIGPQDFAAGPEVRPGDIVILSTGWANTWGSPRWDRHPHLSVAGADWLIARQVKMIVTDFVTPDMAFPLRPADYHSPVHVALLGAGMLIAEQVADPAALAGQRIEALCLPLPIVGCDGALVRFLARAVA